MNLSTVTLKLMGSRAIVMMIALTLAIATVVVRAEHAAAYTITSCHAWQYSAHTMSRDCDTTSAHVLAIQYSDYGSNDGYCVQPLAYVFDGESWHWWGYIGPMDCTQSGVTTAYRSYTQGGVGVGNIAAWRVTSTTTRDYNTTCMSNPANPGFVSLKPYCFS